MAHGRAKPRRVTEQIAAMGASQRLNLDSALKGLLLDAPDAGKVDWQSRIKDEYNWVGVQPPQEWSWISPRMVLMHILQGYNWEGIVAACHWLTRDDVVKVVAWSVATGAWYEFAGKGGNGMPEIPPPAHTPARQRYWAEKFTSAPVPQPPDPRVEMHRRKVERMQQRQREAFGRGPQPPDPGFAHTSPTAGPSLEQAQEAFLTEEGRPSFPQR